MQQLYKRMGIHYIVGAILEILTLVAMALYMIIAGLYLTIIRKNDLSAHVDYADHTANLDTAGFHWITLDFCLSALLDYCHRWITPLCLLSPLDYAPLPLDYTLLTIDFTFQAVHYHIWSGNYAYTS